ncbi:MAG: efflux RND transporter periplasmic adaptor subunit [Kiritimatiellia bacterium]
MTKLNARINLRLAVPFFTAVLLGFVLGFVLRGCFSPRPSSQIATTAPTGQKEQVWTCSMHPQIRQPRPGKCPICGMDLIPVTEHAEEKTGSTELAMSPLARKLAEIQLVPVERRFVDVSLRMVGKVTLDETRVAYITTRVPGRIDRLYVNFVGTPIKKGGALAELYSPELVAAQQELIQASKVRRQRYADTERNASDAHAIFEAVREKLRLWELTEEQITAIEHSGKPREHVTFYSPIEGVVVERMDTFEGMYVETGMRLFTVADLSRVWIKLDAYESDLAWLRCGQPVTFQVEAYPGEKFRGAIAFIDPVLDPVTRTVKVRLTAENPGLRLKPEMFVRARVRVRITKNGVVIVSDLAGKWIAPMHPDIVKNGPGTCDVCGEPLVCAEDLGFASKEPSLAAAPLVIPASAPLITGERALVYAAIEGKEGYFEGREVVLGPRAGDVYVVVSGLKEGELVVARGGFKIDSSLQIQGKVSMMQPEVGAPRSGHAAHAGAVPKTLSTPAGKDGLTD